MKLLTIVGARPQFVKAATISRALRGQSEVVEVIVHTGQHYDPNMSKVFFDELDIPEPAYHLEVGSGNHGRQTGRMLEAIETTIQTEKPDWVLVYGDTNSTLAGALAAVKLHVRVAHVEAGLRSFNRAMPEEINRVLTDHAADLLFAPTETACRNLTAEGLQTKTERTGDVMFDAAIFYASRVKEEHLQTSFGLQAKQYCLATIHRAENTDDPVRLQSLFQALAELSRSMPVILPVHPRTRARLASLSVALQSFPHLRLVDPVGYLDMVLLEKNARLVMTDSGGVQKEAYFFSVPCVTMRTETEWVELVQNGFNFLAGTGTESILASVDRALAAIPDWGMQLYGDGRSAQQIVSVLRERGLAR